MTKAELDLLLQAKQYAPEILGMLHSQLDSSNKKKATTSVTENPTVVAEPAAVEDAPTFKDNISNAMKGTLGSVITQNWPAAAANAMALPIYYIGNKNTLLGNALAAVHVAPNRAQEAIGDSRELARQTLAANEINKGHLWNGIGHLLTGTVDNITKEYKQAVKEQSARDYYDKHDELGNAWWDYQGRQVSNAAKNTPADVLYDKTVGKDTPSDARIKNVMTKEDASEVLNYLINNNKDFATKYCKCVVSDERMKQLALKEDLSPEDTAFVMEQLGIDNSDIDEGNDDVLNKYAENLRNYLYTYKPEATQIDPSINPEEPQIGIMAQDLEKVNPSCVKETPEGVKTVDTNKLALMNAGALGDVVRRLQLLEGVVYGQR